VKRICPGCPSHVPVVSFGLAQSIAQRIPAAARQAIIHCCVDWLTERHPGLTVYLGIVGRPMVPWEQEAAASEVWRVESLPCPFHARQGCLLGGLTTVAGWSQEPLHGPWGWLPCSLLRLLDRPLLRDLASRRLIADAKLASLNRRAQFPIVLPRGTGPHPATAVNPQDMPEKTEVMSDGLLSAPVQSRSD
jgi:hypothetical protein